MKTPMPPKPKFVKETKPDTIENALQSVFDELDKRQAAIEESLKCKVFPIVLCSTTEANKFVTGFARVPDIITRFRLIDKSNEKGVEMSIEACSIAMESLIIKSESDPLIDMNVNFEYWASACSFLQNYMKGAVPVLKKK